MSSSYSDSVAFVKRKKTYKDVSGSDGNLECWVRDLRGRLPALGEMALSLDQCCSEKACYRLCCFYAPRASCIFRKVCQ